MAAKKSTKTRKATRAKATKKSSKRAGRKAPGASVKGLWGRPEVFDIT